MDLKVDSQTALVFDLDDTLYNEVAYLRSAYWELCHYLDTNNSNILFVRLFSLYRSGKNPFEYLAATYSVDKQILLERYRNHYPNIQPFGGVIDVFEKITKKGGKIGIITDGREHTQTNKLKALGLLEFIHYVVISETIGTEKPNLKNFQYMEKALNVQQYYYFGDNFKKDFIAPARLGWQTVGLIDNGLNIHSNQYQHITNKPQHLIRSFEDLNIL